MTKVSFGKTAQSDLSLVVWSTHHATGVANPNKFWRDVSPDTDAALSDTLTHR